MQLKLLAHNLMHRYVQENLLALQDWRTIWARRAAILVPGRLATSGRSRTIHLQPRPVLAKLLE